MSTEAAPSGASKTQHDANGQPSPASPAKGKGKGKFVQQEVVDEDDDEEEEEDDEDEDDDMEEDDLNDIDPSAIIGTRRTRGVRVDYTSVAALEKAGLKPESADDDENEESFVAKDDDMHDD